MRGLWQIETAKELEVLPIGAVVIDDMDDVLRRENEDGGWLMAGYDGLHLPILPAQLIWLPRVERP